MRLSDKVAIVTGGASGIGRAVCELFAQEGASVVVADTDRQGGEETSARIKSAGGDAVFVPTDVSKEPEVEEMVRTALSAYGTINVLVNNAAAFVLVNNAAAFGRWRTSRTQTGGLPSMLT